MSDYCRQCERYIVSAGLLDELRVHRSANFCEIIELLIPVPNVEILQCHIELQRHCYGPGNRGPWYRLLLLLRHWGGVLISRFGVELSVVSSVPAS
jgi:hypothetical protein